MSFRLRPNRAEFIEPGITVGAYYIKQYYRSIAVSIQVPGVKRFCESRLSVVLWEMGTDRLVFGRRLVPGEHPCRFARRFSAVVCAGSQIFGEKLFGADSV
jgi:hypothetical protein